MDHQNIYWNTEHLIYKAWSVRNVLESKKSNSPKKWKENVFLLYSPTHVILSESHVEWGQHPKGNLKFKKDNFDE